MTSLVSERELYIPIPEYGEVVPRVAFRGQNFIVENWLPKRRGLQQYLRETFNMPIDVSSLTPLEVADVWRTLEMKRNDPKYAGMVSKSVGLTEVEAKKLVENFYQELRKYWIRTKAIGVIQDKKGLVYGNDFDPNKLPVVIEDASIQTPNQTYAKKLDDVIIKRVKNDEDTTLDDLVQSKAKFVGERFYLLPKILMETHSDGLKEDVPFLGATKLNFPKGVRYYIDTNPDYGDGYRAVDWILCPADERSSDLYLYDRLEDSGRGWGSLQGRRSADRGIFYRNQLIKERSKNSAFRKDLKEELSQITQNL